MDSKQKIEKNLPSYLKRSSQGGLLVGFIYVAVFMSILILALWQTFESENNKTVILSMDERLSLIEEQIDIVDETNNDSITDISSSIKFLDSTYNIHITPEIKNKLIEMHLFSGNPDTSLFLINESFKTTLPDNIYFNDLMELRDFINHFYTNADEKGKEGLN